MAKQPKEEPDRMSSNKEQFEVLGKADLRFSDFKPDQEPKKDEKQP